MMKQIELAMGLLLFTMRPAFAQKQDIKDASVKAHLQKNDVQLVEQPQKNDEATADSLRQDRQLKDLSYVANRMERSPYSYDVPYYTGMPVWGGYQWDLHKGMNVSLSASAFVTSGNHQYFPSSGYSTDASMMYVMPVNKRLTVAVGGYMSTNNFGRFGSFNDFGIQGMAAYQFNDKLNLYAYGRYSFVNPKIPYPLRAIAPFMKSSSTIGGVLDYKVTPSIRVQVGIRSDQYNY